MLTTIKKIIRSLLKITTKKPTITLAVVFIGIFVWVMFGYVETKKQATLSSDQQTTQAAQEKISQKELQDLENRVSKLIILPEGKPVVMTIQDIKLLIKQQPFFRYAQNGDKVLIYKDQAIVFSPTKNILINVGPVYGNQQVAPDPALITQANYTTIEIRNGTMINGEAKKLADTLKKLGGYKVIRITDAENQDYKKTTLVNLSDKNVDLLEKKLKTNTTKSLPVNEKVSSADVVIIIGENNNN